MAWGKTALRTALKEAFGPSVTLSGGEAGLHLVMWLPQEIRDTDVATRAEALGLGVRALSGYTKAPMICNGLVLGYGNLEDKVLLEGVRRLVLAVQSQSNNRPKRPLANRSVSGGSRPVSGPSESDGPERQLLVSLAHAELSR